MKEIGKLVLILGLICCVSGLALATVHIGTKKAIELNVLNNVQGPALKMILGDFDKLDNNPITDNFKLKSGYDKKRKKDLYTTVFPAKKDGKLEAVALEGEGVGFNGPLRVMVGINTDGKLTGIQVTQHSDTPGIGSRVTEPAFTKQFDGLSIDNPTAVDGVSGASYSTKGVFGAVKDAVDFYKKHQQDILAKVGQ